MALYLEGRTGSVSGRRLIVTRDKPFIIRTRTTHHEGEVQVSFDQGNFRIDNRSHMRCRLNGSEQQQAILSDGDFLEIGKDRFSVVIQPDTHPFTLSEAEDQDVRDTQSVLPVLKDDTAVLAIDAATLATAATVGAVSPIEAPVVCSVCDAYIRANSPGKTWSDGEHHICARCLAKGVKPEHLPRPFPDVAPLPLTPPRGSPVLPDDLRVAAIEGDVHASSSTALLGGAPGPDSDATDVIVRAPVAPIPDSDATDVIVPAPVVVNGSVPTSDSDRQRQVRRISASRLTAVEPAQREGLLSKMGKVFGRRDERQQRLTHLEANRAALLAEAGRHALGAGGSLGLPESVVQSLVSGGTVTISAADLSPADLERWRAQRQRMILLDAEIAALCKALGLGSDTQVHQQSSPTLRPDQKAMQDRAFATLDGLSTDELSRPDLEPESGEVAVKSSPSGRMKPVSARRRR